uniref:Uncharacterized protein n=1 Tax=Octopus bimaculoides TaxID=37653 RepID=A0A0L8GJ89_OCTBM
MRPAAGDQGFGDQAQGSPLKSPSRMRAGKLFYTKKGCTSYMYFPL